MSKYFNKQLIEASSRVFQQWGRRGYKNKAYTHDLSLGNIPMKADSPPFTMCVAAVMEFIVEALNAYMMETGDRSPEKHLTPGHWKSNYPDGTLRDLIWVNSGSRGTADALARYGMGELREFEELEPGGLINFNRDGGPGHAVLFLSYIDGAGVDLAAYGDMVAGFRYISSQGNATNGGIDQKLAFFQGKCPAPPMPGSDCRVLRSKRWLNCGHMWSPPYWDKQQAHAQIETMGDERTFSLPSERGVNPRYLDQTLYETD